MFGALSIPFASRFCLRFCLRFSDCDLLLRLGSKEDCETHLDHVAVRGRRPAPAACAKRRPNLRCSRSSCACGGTTLPGIMATGAENMGFLFDGAVKITTLHERHLVAICMTTIANENPSITSKGKLAKMVADRYVQYCFVNEGLPTGDTTHVWAGSLKGKLDLHGRIDARTIEQEFETVAMSTLRRHLHASVNCARSSGIGSSY